MRFDRKTPAKVTIVLEQAPSGLTVDSDFHGVAQDNVFVHHLGVQILASLKEHFDQISGGRTQFQTTGVDGVVKEHK